MSYANNSNHFTGKKASHRTLKKKKKVKVKNVHKDKYEIKERSRHYGI